MRGHVGPEIVRVVRLGRVLPRRTNLARDDVGDRALLEAFLARFREGIVEVRTDVPLRAGRRERVTAAALLDEELPAVGLIAVADDAARAAAREQEHGSDERQRAEHVRARFTMTLQAYV